MPEIHFQVEWPDGAQDTCYSPSLVVQKYFTAGTEYILEDFVERSRSALKEASDRVLAKYGMPCSLALGQLQQIEVTAGKYRSHDSPKVRLLRFIQ